MIGSLARGAVTLVAVAIAAVIGWQLWTYDTLSPWTRDARACWPMWSRWRRTCPVSSPGSM